MYFYNYIHFYVLHIYLKAKKDYTDDRTLNRKSKFLSKVVILLFSLQVNIST